MAAGEAAAACVAIADRYRASQRFGYRGILVVTPRRCNMSAASVSEITVPVVPMTAESFAPYGEVFGLQDRGPERIMTGTGFGHDGRVTISTIWNPAGGKRFSRLERHFGVTQAFVQLSGAPSVVCAAPPTALDDPSAVPRPADVVGFLIDPAQGYLFHRGTWHALDRCVLAPPGATFLIINSDPNPTQMIDLASGENHMHDDLGGAPPPRALPPLVGARARLMVGEAGLRGR
jgi:ureidoglycolate hydrolase